MSHEALKTELTAKLAELETRLASIKRDVTQAHSSDSAEQAQERENDEVIDAIGDETRAAIAATRAAIARIEAGAYGICDACGGEVSSERLAVLPDATRCINCAA